jgi:hypothetical protein
MIPVPISIVIPVLNLVAVPILLVAISVPVPCSGVSPAAVISVVVVPLVSYNAIIAEARIVSEAGFILPSPLPIFLLALTVEPIVLDIVVPAFSKPFSIIRVILRIVAAVSAVRVWIILITVLRASRGNDCPQSQR